MRSVHCVVSAKSKMVAHNRPLENLTLFSQSIETMNLIEALKIHSGSRN